MTHVQTIYSYSEDGQPTSMSEHDKREHGGQFNPETMTCKLRERQSKGDENDKIYDVDLLSDKNMDKDYMSAVNKGDMAMAKLLVRKAAAKAMPDTKVTGPDGDPLVVFHGTVRDFTVFNKEFSNIEGDMGKGYYFSNNSVDVDYNYASVEGADLTNRIERMAESLEYEDDEDGNPKYGTQEERINVAKERLKVGTPRKLSVYLNMTNPFEIGSENPTVGAKSTWLDFSEDYDEENDEYGEPTGLLVTFVDNLINVLADNGYENADMSKIYSHAIDYGGMTAAELERLCKDMLSDCEDENGDLAGSEFFREAVERSGYDGIVDKTVNRKFGSTKKFGNGLPGMDSLTCHYIAFRPEQIKLADAVTYDDEKNVIPLSKRFNLQSEDIRDEANGKIEKYLGMCNR